MQVSHNASPRRWSTHRGLALAAAGALTLGASIAVGSATAPPATAAPCGDTSSTGSSGNNSLSGNSSLSGNGSLGGGAPVEPGQGPQGNLPTWSNTTSKVLSWVTGPKSPNKTLSRFTISGTDLGVAWDNGAGQTLMAFGDTFGWCNIADHQWRNNVLLRTTDSQLSDGLSIPDGTPGDRDSGAVVNPQNFATELVPGQKIANVEVTTIPTAAISIGGKQYMNFMSVRHWGDAGVWDTNFSAIAVSGDNGQTWAVDQGTMMVNAPVTFALPAAAPTVNVNNSRFQQSGYVRGRSSDGTDDGWIYQVGTPNGRFGNAYLARFRPTDILNLVDYDYWTGTGWTRDLGLLTDNSAIVTGNITELSVAWSPFLHKYVMLDGDNAIRLRTAPTMHGPWSAPRTLVPSGAVILYGPMMLPQSPALTGTGNQLYFNASRWSDYNVMLIESKLNSAW
ncbi:MAG: DUF4185 domain-containing protein [Gordonia sp. (in: high G+C Gram-positive bacteria)]|uniref:DUF4185 domain-containing protein n=1 Tax=Gordonia sp. (in: high G+C Gram-positive bacteria) TaxID=84139 RepID=UPI003BB4DE9B